jgi:hypothetical protein
MFINSLVSTVWPSFICLALFRLYIVKLQASLAATYCLPTFLKLRFYSNFVLQYSLVSLFLTLSLKSLK